MLEDGWGCWTTPRRLIHQLFWCIPVLSPPSMPHGHGFIIHDRWCVARSALSTRRCTQNRAGPGDYPQRNQFPLVPLCELRGVAYRDDAHAATGVCCSSTARSAGTFRIPCDTETGRTWRSGSPSARSTTRRSTSLSRPSMDGSRATRCTGSTRAQRWDWSNPSGSRTSSNGEVSHERCCPPESIAWS
jgi:hypothetical protein